MNENPQSEQTSQPNPPPQVVRVAMPTVKPYVMYAILGITIFVYILQLTGQYLFASTSLVSLMRSYGLTDVMAVLGEKVNALIRAGEVWRLITPVFLHDSSLPYGLLHIGFNMYALYIFGRGAEARYGHWRFLLLYFLSAFAGNVFSFLLTPNASLGASTAIFGLLAAEGVFIIQNRKLLGKRADGALINVVTMAALNLFIGLAVTGVDNWGHLGGLTGGLLFAWFGGPRWKIEGIYPSLQLVDEREGHGALAGTIAVLLIFIPLTAMGWIWPR